MSAAKLQKKGPPSLPGRPTLLMVGMDPMSDAIRAATTRHRLQVETCGLADIPSGVLAAAPDLVLLIGDAAASGGQDVLRLLALNPATNVVPVAILTDDASLDDRLKAFRYGAVAVVQRTASADAIGKRVAELARELPERDGKATGQIGEATLDEFVELLKRELRSGILSVSGKDGDEGEAVRIVLGAGRPVADALKDFVQKLKPLVAEAEPLKYELLEESGGRLQLLEPSGLLNLPKADPSILEGTRILVMDSDPGRADALAQELRGHAAKVAVTEVSERGLDKARGLEPEVLIIDGADIDGPAFELVRGLRKDPRLRWTSMLIVSWDELWPHRDGGPDLPLLAAKIAPLISQDHELTSRCEREEQFDTRLETTGPGRMVRALVKAKKTVHVTVVNPKATIELDLSQGLLVGASGVLADGSEVAGAPAIKALLVLSSGRVRIERRMNPATANVMTPVDEALAAAWAEDSPIAQSIPPPEGPAAATPGPRPVAPPVPVPMPPKTGFEELPTIKDIGLTGMTPSAGMSRKVVRTMMGMASPPLPPNPVPPPSQLSAFGGVPGSDRLTPKLPEIPLPEGAVVGKFAIDDEPTQRSDPNLTPIATKDDVAALMAGELEFLEADALMNDPRSIKPGELMQGAAPRADPTIVDPPSPGVPAEMEEAAVDPTRPPPPEQEEKKKKKKGAAGIVVAALLVLLLAAGAAAAWFFVPEVRQMLGFGEGPVVADNGGDVAPDGTPDVAADAAAEGASDVGEPAADAATLVVDDEGADDEGADDEGADDEGADDEGAGDEGADDEGADDEGADDEGVDPDRSARSLAAEAEGMIRRGEVLEAGPLLERAYQLDQDDNHILAGLARVYIERGDGARAVRMAEAAVEKRSRRVSYRMLLGRAQELAGDAAAARATYNRVLQQESGHAEARRRLGALRE